MEENNNDKVMKAINTKLEDENITAEDKVGLLQEKVKLMESGTGSGTGGQGDGQGNENMSSHDLIKNGLKALKGDQS